MNAEIHLIVGDIRASRLLNSRKPKDDAFIERVVEGTHDALYED